MSEAIKWTELAEPQADFLKAQVDAVVQATLTPAAQEAGIVVPNASRYNIRVDNQILAAVMWPDTYAQDAACIVTKNASGHENFSSFTRITVQPESIVVEGVALALGYVRRVNLYGKWDAPRSDVEQEVRFSHAGLKFVTAALNKIDRSRGLSATSQQQPTATFIGVDGHTTGRLFRSLNSLGSGLIVTGSLGEKGRLAGQTYDLANALLKMSINSVSADTMKEDEAILVGPTGDASGAAFESERDGIVMISRANTFPDSIVLLAANRPEGLHEQFFLEQYTIHAWGTTLDFMTLPAEHYNLRAIVDASGTIGSSIQDTDVSPLSEEGTRTLEQKIVRIMSERAGLPSSSSGIL